jgi:hypothetical protein
MTVRRSCGVGILSDSSVTHVPGATAAAPFRIIE